MSTNTDIIVPKKHELNSQITHSVSIPNLSNVSNSKSDKSLQTHELTIKTNSISCQTQEYVKQKRNTNQNTQTMNECNNSFNIQTIQNDSNENIKQQNLNHKSMCILFFVSFFFCTQHTCTYCFFVKN